MTMTCLGRLALLAGASLLALGAGAARAQGVDYGALEQLFGEPVTTSATGKPQKVSEVPADMDIITQDDIRRSGADNIPDILNFVAGIDVRRNSFSSASVSVRGMNSPNSPRLLVLVNGRQVYLDDYGYVAWQTIPVELDEIRQIEVVKGPNSALFGFNAVGGVINIITYDPLKDNVNAVTARTGTQSLAEGSVVTTVHAYDTAGLRVSAGGYVAHEFETNAGTPNPVTPTRGSLSADSRYQITPDVEMSLSASDSGAKGLADGGTGDQLNFFYRLNSVQAGVVADTPIGTVGLNAYRNEMLVSPTGTDWRNDVYVVQASDLVKLGTDHTIRLGLEYRNNAVTGALFGGNGGAGYDVYAGSAMWNWDITPTLSLTNAARFDYVTLNHPGTVLPGSGLTQASYDNKTLTAISYNSGLVYKVTDADTVRLTAARGVQLPSLVDFALQIAEGPVIESGTPNLNVSAVSNYEISYDRSLEAISSTVRASLFYEREDNVLSDALGMPFSLVNGQLLALSENVGYSVDVGAELGIRGHSESGFRWKASYALASVSDHLTVNKGVVPTVDLNFQQGSPVHAVIVGGGYSIGKWEFDAQAKWQSSYLDYSSAGGGAYLVPVMIHDFITLNARVGYKLTETISVALSGQQLAQNRIVESAGSPVERRVIASLTAHF
jgi:outer membrane receptor for ferrienterochelin and colicins